MAESSEVLRARARLAILTRHRKAKDPELIEAKRDYQVAMLRDHVRRVVDEMPPATHPRTDRRNPSTDGTGLTGR